MNKLLLPYNKTILKTNIIFSIFLTLLSVTILPLIESIISSDKQSIHSQTYLIILAFILWIMTGGFGLSIFYFEITRKNEYYFYYNLGLSKIKLLLITYLLHLIFILPFLYILQYV